MLYGTCMKFCYLIWESALLHSFFTPSLPLSFIFHPSSSSLCLPFSPPATLPFLPFPLPPSLSFPSPASLPLPSLSLLLFSTSSPSLPLLSPSHPPPPPFPPLLFSLPSPLYLLSPLLLPFLLFLTSWIYCGGHDHKMHMTRWEVTEQNSHSFCQDAWDCNNVCGVSVVHILECDVLD